MTKVISKEFKAQIVELHRGGRSFMDLAREFNISATSVASWVRLAERADASAARGNVSGGESDSAKIARLERELAAKDAELEILGKALAFFARRADR
jgi:transposase